MNNNSMMRFLNKALVTRIIGFTIVSVFTLCASVEAQQFKLEGYLKKKDTNSNGRVDPDEMSDNTRGFLKKMGFDPSKPISISKIVSKSNNDRKEATAKASKTSRTRKVPGFGVEGKTESTGVSRFGSSEAVASKSTKTEKYSDSVKKQVKDTLSRYDRNKDGTLDRDELKRARWGSPPPEQSDTNKDGRLTKTELANRYVAREKYYRSSNSSSRTEVASWPNEKNRKIETGETKRDRVIVRQVHPARRVLRERRTAPVRRRL